jgi:GTP-binding protein Era
MKTIPPSEYANDFRCGWVAIIGAPNAGKSTLLNRMLGQKISITSKKPQTTRNRILGVLDRPGTQLIFLDTPGVHEDDHPLNQRIADIALSALKDADLALVIVDASAGDSEAETYLLSKLKNQKTKAILALNKIDLIPKPDLLILTDQWIKAYAFEAVVPISAAKGIQVDVLLKTMQKALPLGPPLYPPGSLTDLSERFIAAEMIREKAFRLTGQEIPYSVAVTVEQFKETRGGNLVEINATIHVERDSQKGIVIGKGGRKLKQIGESARKEIEHMVGCKVFLELHVRVQKNWSKDTKALRNFGY